MELLKLSITDSLIGIYNRVKFDQELNQWIDYCSMHEIPLSLVIFDIDDFKKSMITAATLLAIGYCKT